MIASLTAQGLVVGRLYEEAHNYANLANRSGPIVTDLMEACKVSALEAKDLHICAVKSARKRKRLCLCI
jgi:transcription initiation factor TFIID subunit 8